MGGNVNDNKIKIRTDRLVFDTISYIFCITFALVCLLPFIMVISGSFSSESYILSNGYTLLPGEFSVNAYAFLFRSPEVILRAYGVTAFVTVTGTVLALITMSMTAYAISRKTFRSRNAISFYFYFTMLFWGGILPYYILISKYLHLKNNLIVLLVPGMINIFNLMIIRSFIASSISDSIIESVKIDGGGEFTIFFKIVLPLIKPTLAAIGMFTALSYWNDWWNVMLFIDDRKLYNLQYTLYNILNKLNYLSSMKGHAVNMVLPKETIKLAMTVVAIGPLVIVYPFIQKYFVKGVTLGAVKG